MILDIFILLLYKIFLAISALKYYNCYFKILLKWLKIMLVNSLEFIRYLNGSYYKEWLHVRLMWGIFKLLFRCVCCKGFTLAQRGLENILPNKNVFVSLGVSSLLDSLTMIQGWGFGSHDVSSASPGAGDWGQPYVQPTRSTWPMKRLDPKALVGSPG